MELFSAFDPEAYLQYRNTRYRGHDSSRTSRRRRTFAFPLYKDHMRYTFASGARGRLRTQFADDRHPALIGLMSLTPWPRTTTPVEEAPVNKIRITPSG